MSEPEPKTQHHQLTDKTLQDFLEHYLGPDHHFVGLVEGSLIHHAFGLREADVQFYQIPHMPFNQGGEGNPYNELRLTESGLLCDFLNTAINNGRLNDVHIICKRISANVTADPTLKDDHDLRTGLFMALQNAETRHMAAQTPSQPGSNAHPDKVTQTKHRLIFERVLSCYLANSAKRGKKKSPISAPRDVRFDLRPKP